MKKFRFLFLLLAAPFLLAACNDDDDNTTINFDQLPQTAQTFVNSNFPGITVMYTLKDDDSYKVRTKDYNMEFNLSGDWDDLKAYGAPLPESVINLLPEGIRTYVTDNYPAYRIIEIDREAWGYEVELNDYQGTELYFDTNGNFLRKETNRPDNGSNIDPATLPEAIKTFVTAHFPDLQILKAEKDGNEYEVYLQGYSLEFRLDGTWKSFESYRGALPQSLVNLLPQKTITYLNTNYQGVGVQEIEFESNKYEVQLLDNARTELEFDKEGNFLRIDK